MSLLKPMLATLMAGPVPTLDLDFTAEELDPRITFTRASTKTYFGADGLLKTALANEWPREFDPVTGECLGRSVWEQRTNQFLHSAAFDNAVWVKSFITVTPAQGIAPDGTNSLALLEMTTTGAGNPNIRRTIPTVAGVPQTISVFVKAGTYNIARLRDFTQIGWADFNLDTLEATVNGIFSAPRISPLGNGLLRVSATFTPGTTGGHEMGLQVPGTQIGHSILAWGLQAEIGSFASPYIPTTTASVTRSFEAAEVNDISSFGYLPESSSWTTDATVFGEAGTSASGYFIGLGSNSNNNIFRGPSGVFDNRPNVGIINPSSNTPEFYDLSGQRVRIGGSHTRFEAHLGSVNGTTRAGSLVGAGAVDFANFDRLGIGNAGRGASKSFGIPNAAIHRVRYWPLLLSQQELNGLTG